MNLFKQAMYSKKIRSKEDAPKNTNNRDIMCSQGITGVKAGSLSHGQKWRQHKYLYKEGDRYIYPEDVQKKEGGNDTLKKVGDAILSTNKLTKYPYLAYKAGQKIKPQTVSAAEPEEKRTGIIHEKRQKAKEEEKRRIERNRKVAAVDAEGERRRKTEAVDIGGYSRSNEPEDLKTGLYKRSDDKKWDEHERNLKRIKLKTKQKKNAEKYKPDEMSKVGAQAKLKKGVDNMRRNAAINEGLAAARKELEDRNRKRRDQQHSAHQNAYYYDHTAGNDFYESKAERRKNINQQRKSAHAGYEEDRKKYEGDETSTEELENQKDRTKTRKARKTMTRTEAGVEAGRKRKKPKISKEYQEELAYNSKKNVYPEKVLKENIITENIITEKDSLPEKKKKKKRLW